MSRRAVEVERSFAGRGGNGAGSGRGPVRADEDSRTVLPFLQELRDRGLHD